mgnify:CR=1 FL=1
MKNLTFITVAFISLGLGACSIKTKILDAPAVSMTRTSLNKGETLKSVVDVQGQFCTDMGNDSGNIGLMDEAVKDAQNKSGVDFITNAVFYASAKCVSVEGTGNKVTK